MDFFNGIFTEYRGIILILGGSSIFLFIITPLIIPLVIRNMKPDYFLRVSEAGVERSSARTFFYYLWHIVKNVLGLIFLMTGFILLFVPGQGILTMIAGMILLDFPGKHRMINRLARGDRIRRGLNWIRRKTGRREFVFQEREKEEENERS